MKIKPKQYAISLYEAVKNVQPSEVGIIIGNFIELLVKNNALKMSPQIFDYLQKHINKIEGIVNLKIKTIEQLSEENLSRLKSLVPLLVGKEVKKINIQQEIDSSLIGGFVLECDDLVFDASIKNKFNILRNKVCK